MDGDSSKFICRESVLPDEMIFKGRATTIAVLVIVKKKWGFSRGCLVGKEVDGFWRRRSG